MQTKLIRYRKQRGLTQKKMSDMLRCSEKTYRDKELGKRPFNLDEMHDIASILEKNISDIFLPLE